MQSSLISGSTHLLRKNIERFHFLPFSPCRFQEPIHFISLSSISKISYFSAPKVLAKSSPWPTSCYTNRKSSFLLLIQTDKYASSMHVNIQICISIHAYISTCSLTSAVNLLPLVRSHKQYPGRFQQKTSFRC